ncbi:MAG: ribonuclease domain-containing protein [Edwardsiella piscicida]
MNGRSRGFFGLILALSVMIAGGVVLAQHPARGVSDEPTQQTEASIEQLTRQARVVAYLQANQRLPDYYITKRQARAAGWDPARGNLCQVVPGRAIGGDRFANREGRLPQQAHRIWREADINYRCGRRQADRVLYSNDGLIYVTRDHYRHFTRME